MRRPALHRHSSCALLLGALALHPGLAAATPAPDWPAAGQEVTALLQAYLRTDTTNPPGHETDGARFLAERLAAEGIESQILEGGPGRGNLIARVKGDGTLPPLCLLSHIDVVTAEPSSWPADKGPLSGVLDDQGYVWGRGALDMKGMGAIEAMTLILLQRSGARLKRDVVLLAVADEEVDNEGIRFIADQHWDKVGCSHVINEGGIGISDLFFPGQTVYPISVGEKGVLWARLIASGEPGHGSTPVPDRAPQRLMQAVAALEAREVEPTFHPALLETIAAAGVQKGGLTGFILQHPRLAKRVLRGRFMENPITRAAVTTTVNVTGFGGANEPNVVPGEVWANIDARVLPGQTPEQVLAELQALTPWPWVRYEVLSTHPAAVSQWDDPLFRALVARSVEGRPDVVAGPVISVGYTDSVYLRPKGVTAYGFVPFEVSAEELGTMHGNNERVSTANLERGLRILYSAVADVSM